MAKDLTDILTRAAEVRDESIAEQNTAQKVGAVLTDLIDLLRTALTAADFSIQSTATELHILVTTYDDDGAPIQSRVVFPLASETKAGVLTASQLQSALLMPYDRRVILRDVVPWRTLPIVGLVALETSEEVEDGVRFHTTKLSATLEETFVFPERPIAFLASSVNGSRFLIGTAQRPFPLVNQNSVLPSNSTENSITGLVVNFTSQIPLVKTQY